jgi:hypothetical protein
MNVVEIWRAIPSQPGLLASSLGRLMMSPYFSEKGCMPRQYGGTPTKGQWDGSRYIYSRKGYKTQKVARLICEAFHGKPPFERAVCMHKDENSRNNNPVNLMWGTQKENLNAPGFLEYCRGRTGANNPHIKGKMKEAA